MSSNIDSACRYTGGGPACLQGWRSSLTGDDPSRLGHYQESLSAPEGTQIDRIHGPEGLDSFVMDPPELPRDSVGSHLQQQASASGDSTNGNGEEAASFQQHGGTLVVAPPSVVKAVWARELASKVMTTHGHCTLRSRTSNCCQAIAKQ